MLILVAKLVLVGVFGVAGIAKLADRNGVRRAIVQFGLPASLASPFAWGLIVTELCVATALLFGPSARAGALAALVLLASFSVAIALNLIRGRHPECHCFGRVHAAPVGWATEARNGLLASSAALVVADGRLSWLFATLAIMSAGV